MDTFLSNHCLMYFFTVRHERIKITYISIVFDLVRVNKPVYPQTHVHTVLTVGSIDFGGYCSLIINIIHIIYMVVTYVKNGHASKKKKKFGRTNNNIDAALLIRSIKFPDDVVHYFYYRSSALLQSHSLPNRQLAQPYKLQSARPKRVCSQPNRMLNTIDNYRTFEHRITEKGNILMKLYEKYSCGSTTLYKKRC